MKPRLISPYTVVPPALREAIDAVNPVPAPRPDEPLDERARDDLARILATTPVTEGPEREVRAHRPGRRGLAVAMATLLAVAVSFLIGGHRQTGSAYAATPPILTYTPAGTDAPGVLREIAARTAALPDTTGGGTYAFVATRDWDLFSRIDNDERVTSEVVERRTSTWTASDGSGRLLRRYRVPWQRTHVDDETLPAGGLGLMWPLRSLSADDETLARQLGEGHPAENGPAERLVAVKDAYRQMPLPPAVRAAVLRYLADTPGITLAGRVTDRAGRAGIAVALDSDYSGLPTRYTLILDPGDGRLLGSEDMLTTTAGKLNVRVPCVIGYTVYLDGSRYTDTTEE